MKKTGLFFGVFFCFVLSSIAGTTPETTAPQSPVVHYHAKKNVSFNVKVQPAIYWGTIGLEMEWSVGHNASFGINTLGKLAVLDQSPINNRIRTSDFQQNGLMTELFFRYYLHDKEHKSHFAPAGFYVHFNAGANFNVYADGSLRPFSIINFAERKEGDQNQTLKTITRPQPYFGGVGIGYQIIIFPQHLIGNVFLGTQANVTGDNKFQMSIYISPSIGWLF